MKKAILFIQFLGLLLLAIAVKAQTPPADLNGTDLRTWLKANYFTGKHITLGYSTARKWMYNNIDNHNNTITCVYSGLTVSWTYGGTGTNPDPINCEHTIPQSFFGSADPMVSDLHHLFPTYSTVNSTRSNYPFTEINDDITAKWMYLSTTLTTKPTTNIDLYSEYYNSTFEPREDHKGDLARAIFYFYTMYPTEAGAMSQVGDINTFYQWHLADPVSAAELQRNNDIQTYQGDRNPYIDQPELVARAWGFSAPTPTVPSAPALTLQIQTSSLVLNWADVANETGYYVYRSVNGGSYTQIANLTANTIVYTDNNVTTGNTYSYYAIAYNATGNSTNSNTVNGQLSGGTGGTGNATDLFISEYVEGSSNNKVLEIANYTGASVSLANYTLRKQVNGAGAWGADLVLTGTLNHGQVYVIANSSATTNFTSKANLTTAADVITFNGNDPVGLFKNGTLIDIIGTFNGGSANFAIDVTLVRKSSVSKPVSTYNITEWDSYAVDTYSYLGSHVFNGGTTQTCGVPSGLQSSNITTTSANVSWTAVTGAANYTLDYKAASATTWTSVTVTGTTYSLTGLTAATSYQYKVKTNCSSSNSAYSTEATFTTATPTITYCTSRGNSTADEWINKIAVGTFSYTSGANGGYGNFTTQTINLSVGVSNTLTITPAWSASVYKEGYAAWIDYNKDGDFADAGEQIFSKAASTSSTVSGSFTVPTTALTGTTRMRISLKYNAIPTACETFSYGEVEDYTVNISAAKAITENIATENKNNYSVFVYPNPATDYSVIKVSQTEISDINIRVTNLSGQIIYSINQPSAGTNDEFRIDLSSFQQGIYFITVQGNNYKEVKKLIKR